MNERNKRRTLHLMAALAFVVLVVAAGRDGRAILLGKADAQQTQTQVLRDWIQSYKDLQGPQREWEREYIPVTEITQLLTLFRRLNLTEHGLRANVDRTVVTREEAVTYQGAALGLRRVCLASKGRALQIAADTYQDLFSGVAQIAERPDLEIGQIVVEGQKEAPRVKLEPFCVLLRNPTPDEARKHSQHQEGA